VTIKEALALGMISLEDFEEVLRRKLLYLLRPVVPICERCHRRAPDCTRRGGCADERLPRQTPSEVHAIMASVR